MCLIVDANRFGDFLDEDAPDSQPIWDWLKRRGGCLVLGGSKYQTEIEKSPHTVARFAELKRSGRVASVPSSAVDARHVELEASGALRSDDPHVIALAAVSGARTLYSFDDALIDDFRDKKLIDEPRGKVYKRAEHRHLLGHTRGCRRPV